MSLQLFPTNLYQNEETFVVYTFLPPHIRAADDDHTPELYS